MKFMRGAPYRLHGEQLSFYYWLSILATESVVTLLMSHLHPILILAFIPDRYSEQDTVYIPALIVHNFTVHVNETWIFFKSVK